MDIQEKELFIGKLIKKVDNNIFVIFYFFNFILFYYYKI